MTKFKNPTVAEIELELYINGRSNNWLKCHGFPMRRKSVKTRKMYKRIRRRFRLLSKKGRNDQYTV